MQRFRAMRAGQEAGAVAVLVMILLAGGVLLGMAALTVDVGSLYGERRQLQNSADAGALSLAQDCAAGLASCNDIAAAKTSISGLVNSNDTTDHTTAISSDSSATAPDEGICISNGGSPVGTCGVSSGLRACLPVPAGIDHYVEVYTSTDTSNGGHLLPPSFAQSLVPDYEGANVGACSRVAWGGPKKLTSAIPLTISTCEYQHYVGAGNFAPPPPYPPWPATYEHTIFFHSPDDLNGGCPAGPAGSDLPGGFGWLKSSNCEATSDIDNWFAAGTGVSPGSTCQAAEFGLSLGQVVHIPIYDVTNGLSGANGQYQIQGYAAFVLTGYHLLGNGTYSKKSLITGEFPCLGSDKCISGFFIQDPDPESGEIGGPSMGVTVIQMAG